MSKGACWKSNLDLHHQDDDTESLYSATENYGDPKETPVGPFMHSLFQKQLYTDVDFAFKSTKECLSAHRVVLAAKSEFFADLLFGDKKNNAGTGTKIRMDIFTIPYTVFKDIVNYIYTDDIDFPDLPTVLDIHLTANKFKLQSLIDLCDHYINELELTVDNACSTLQISNSKLAHNLKNRCIEFIKNHTQEVISSPDFEKSSFNTVREITNLQDLTLRSESEMLEAVLRWINVQPDHTKVELRKSLMKCIRFVSFTPKGFRDVIKHHSEVLTSGEALDTLIYLNDPTAKNMKGLPVWMNRSPRTFSQRIREIRQSNDEKFEIPLTAASGQQELDSLTSILNLKSIKGYHRINGIKVLLEDISNDGNMITVIVLKAHIVPRGYHTYFSKTVDSKEAVIKFPKAIVLEPGRLLNLEAQIYGCQSCKFFQFDISKEDDLKEKVSEHFECSVSSKPKQGRLYFLNEVLYKSFTTNGIRSYKRGIQRKKIKNLKENQAEKGEDKLQ